MTTTERKNYGDLGGLSLQGKAPRNGRHDLVPGTQYGWLTVVNRSAGDGRYTKFTCRRGAPCIRMTHHVVKAQRAGVVTKCDECTRAHKSESLVGKPKGSAYR